MIDVSGSSNEPVRFNARTRVTVLAVAGWTAAITALLGVSIAVGYGWDGWLLTIPLLAVVAILAGVFGSAMEWTVAGNVLSGRRWYSRPGISPAQVAQLRPHLRIVHEGRYLWRVRPSGPAIYVQPWRAVALAEAMHLAGVQVDDWRGEWALRHRMLDSIGLAIQFASAAGMFLAIVLGGSMRPLGFVSFWASMAGLLVGLTIDVGPWKVAQLREPGRRG